MKNFTNPRPCRPHVWRRCLLMLVAMLAFGATAFAQNTKYQYEVSHTDIGCGVWSGTATLTVIGQNGEKPNGSARIRRPGAPDEIIMIEGVKYGDDATLVQSTEDPNRWTHTWLNLPAGQYVLSFLTTNDPPLENGGTVTVAEITENYQPVSMSAVVQNPYCSATGGNNGSVKVTVTGGEGPFHYTAVIMDKNGNTTRTLSSGTNPISDRTWTVTDLAAEDAVRVTVSDTQHGICPNNVTSAILDTIIKKQLPSPEVNVVRFSRVYSGKCGTFEDYIGLTVTNKNNLPEQAMREQLELIKTSVILHYKDNNAKLADLEFAPDVSNVTGSSSYSVYFKIRGNENDYNGGPLYVSYKDLCSGAMRQTENGTKKVTDFNMSEHIYRFSGSGLVTTTSGCNEAKTGYFIYYYKELLENWYYFPAGTEAQLQKKNGDTWETLPDVHAYLTKNGLAFPTQDNGQYKIDVTTHGPGTYRMAYTDVCGVTTYTREITIEPEVYHFDIGGESLELDCKMGIHGNTAGTSITIPGYGDNVDIKIERADGATSHTYKVTEFLSDVEYDYTMNFPIILHDFPVSYKETDGHGNIINGIYELYDIPDGSYKITFQDLCGNTSQTATLDIGGNVIKYKPKNTDGYKDGFKVMPECGGGNKVMYDFGVGSSCGIPYSIKKAFYTTNSQGQKVFSGDQGYEDGNDILDPGTLKEFEMEVDIHRPFGYKVKVYSLMMGRFRPYYDNNSNHIGENDFFIKSFKIPLPDAVQGFGAFEIGGAMCNKNDPHSGVITVGVRKGYNVTFPIRYELRKGKLVNGVPDFEPNTIDAATITDSSQPTLRVFSDLEQGWYEVSTQYNLGGGCPAQKFRVFLSPVDIPEIEADWVEKCYDKGLAPNHLEIPISTYMYDITWTRKDIDTGVETTEGTGSNAVDVTFDKPGTYKFTVSTKFTDAIPKCSGSSGGERSVTINVGDCAGAMNNLWVGNVDTKFENQDNWTVKIPDDGEDVVFATEANNANNNNPEQRGAAKNDCVLPAGKTLTISTLKNESDKAFVVSKTSSVVVAKALVGYDQPKDTTKLLIKTDDSGTDASGSFSVSYADPCNSKVYATVELYGRGKKVGNEPLEIQDNLEGSPTYGRTLLAEPYSWQQIGIPVTDMKPSPVFKGSYLQYYSEAKNSPKQYYQKWSWMNKDSQMLPFVGYQLTQETPKVYAIAGKLNLCDHVLTLTRHAAEVTASTSTKEGEKHWGLGQNIFANSYTAGIDIAQLSFPDEVDPTVYVYHTGSFSEWYGNKSATSQDPNAMAAGGYLAVPKYSAKHIGYASIPSMQGFLLKFTDAETKVSEVTATVTIPYQSVVNNERAAMAKPFDETTTEPGVVQMVLESSKGSDMLWLIEAEGTTPGYDRGWDGPKLLANAPVSMYVQTDNGQMQVNTTDDITQQQVTVEGSDSEQYTLTIRKHNLPQYDHLKLVDYTDRQLVDLREDVTSYTYTMRYTGKDSNRFMLVNTTATSFDDLPTDIQHVTPSNWSGPAIVYNMSGDRVTSVSLPEDMKRLKAQLPAGVYIVSMQVDGKTVNRKLVVAHK